MFEEATRKKFRFPIPDGYGESEGAIPSKATLDRIRCGLFVEDLWDLTREQLNDVFKKLVVMCKTAPDASLLGDHADITEELRTKLRIVEYIFDFKQTEAGTTDIIEVESDE